MDTLTKTRSLIEPVSEDQVPGQVQARGPLHHAHPTVIGRVIAASEAIHDEVVAGER